MKQILDLAELLDLPELPKYLTAVEHELLISISTDNQAIYQPISRLIKAGGKRLRPALVIAFASLNGNAINQDTIRLACSVELLHLGSLVHDDIIDEAKSRWNVATINSREGINQAIVIGDYLFASACALAATVSKSSAEIISSTIIKLCDGQNRELNEVNNLKRTQDSLIQAVEGKTAALISAACILGGLQDGLENKIKELENYGQCFGISFQLIDDLMDLLSTEELYGKPIGTDIIEGVYTLPIIFGLQTNQNEIIKKSILAKTFNKELINALFQSDVFFKNIKVIEEYNLMAANEIKSVNENLSNLPADYFSWAVNNLVAKKHHTKILAMQNFKR